MTYNFDSESFRNTSLYRTFMEEHQGNGILKVEAYTASGAYPLEGVEIIISKNIGDDKVIFFDKKTNASGIIEAIVLPTIKQNKVVEAADDIVYTTYDLEAKYPEYNLDKMYSVSIFDDIKVIKPITFPINELIEGEPNQ